VHPRSDLQELNQLEDKSQYIIGYFESRYSAQYENFRKTAMNLKAGLRIRILFIRIRIQHFRLNTDPDPSRALMTKTCEKITAEKFFFCIF
jgi:hypothetical protein